MKRAQNTQYFKLARQLGGFVCFQKYVCAFAFSEIQLHQILESLCEAAISTHNWRIIDKSWRIYFGRRSLYAAYHTTVGTSCWPRGSSRRSRDVGRADSSSTFALTNVRTRKILNEAGNLYWARKSVALSCALCQCRVWKSLSCRDEILSTTSSSIVSGRGLCVYIQNSVSATRAKRKRRKTGVKRSAQREDACDAISLRVH